MKRVIALMVVLTGFMFADVNAQACCKTKKECKPKQCCPSKLDCCKSTKTLESSAADTTEATAVNDAEQPTIKAEKTAVGIRKEE